MFARWRKKSTDRSPAAGATSVPGGASVPDAKWASEGASEADDLPPAVRRRMAAPKKRVMARDVIAVRVVEAIRHGKKTHAYLPADIDEAVEWWCTKHKVVRPGQDVMREAIKVVAGVDFARLRLKSRPDLDHIREELRAANKSDDRAWIYSVLSQQALAEMEADAAGEARSARSRSAQAPALDRAGRTRGGPRLGSEVDSVVGRRKTTAPADDDVVIGHETPPRPARRAA